MYTVIVTLLHFVCITGRCCKQHLVQLTTLDFGVPQGSVLGLMFVFIQSPVCSYTQPSLFLYRTAQFDLIHSPVCSYSAQPSLFLYTAQFVLIHSPVCSYTAQSSLFLYTAQFVLMHSPFHTSSPSVVLTSTCFRTIHSFSILSLLPTLVPLLKRQRRVSNMSRFGWIQTNSNLTTTKLRHWLSVFAPELVSLAMSV